MKFNLEFTEGWSSGELLEKVSSFRGGMGIFWNHALLGSSNPLLSLLSV